MKDKLLERFIKYVKINTRSDSKSTTVPSTQRQFDLANILYEECKSIGLSDVHMDKYGIVTATLPSNVKDNLETIGFIAHMDTADFNSENVKPRVINNYNGKDILLNEDRNIILSIDDFPNLKKHVGQTLIVTDGTTLLGADDKAGITAIMTAMEYLINNPNIDRPRVRIAFTIDEEIGTGANHFDVDQFGADFAYTVDGGSLGEMEYETFNAAEANVSFDGISVHPGSAKDKMINAMVLAHEFYALIPVEERPEHTEHYEGFYMLTEMRGNVDYARVELIIRDHDRNKFQMKKDHLKRITAFMNDKYNRNVATLTIKDTYYNMKEIIENNMEIVYLAQDAMKALNIDPKISPVRGGTDGSKLSFMGLPCPNLFTGGENFHGPYEFAVLETMEKSAEVISKICELHASR